MDLVSSETTYKVDLDQVKVLIAKALNEPLEKVTVTFVLRDKSAEMERNPNMVVDHLRVVVDNSKPTRAFSGRN